MAYNTCMDIYCSPELDTRFGRCVCSDKFRDIQSTRNMLDTAVDLLRDFDDNMLTRVGLTAAEATAVGTATEGEAASERVRDISKATSALNDIMDVLAGRQPSSVSSFGVGNSAVISTVGLFDVSDIWAGGGDIWGTSSRGGDTSGANFGEREGRDRYTEANRMCSNEIRTRCPTDTAMSLVRSAYSVLINESCIAAERSTDEARANADLMLRTANRALGNARLEAYHDRNSASVNECIAKVRTEMMHDSACGKDWVRCLDIGNSYLNPDGTVKVSPQLFRLTSTITLGGSNVINMNQPFVNFLNSKRPSAENVLRNCSDDSNYVWNAFLQQALMEISQQQFAVIEKAKDSCIETIADCYEDQGDRLSRIDKNRMSGAQMSRVLSGICVEKVSACAALHCPGAATTQCPTCTFTNGKITNETTCGLSALFAFVNAVNDVSAQEACVAAVNARIENFCGEDLSGCTHDCTGITTGACPKRSNADGLIRDHINSAIASYCPKDDTELVTRVREILMNQYFPGEIAHSQTCSVFGGTWAEDTQYCSLNDAWYEARCQLLGGNWASDVCTIQ